MLNAHINFDLTLMVPTFCFLYVLITRLSLVIFISLGCQHVVGIGLGAVFANQLVKWDVKLKEDLEVMLNKARAANERRYFDEDRD
ncbi:hypothetical protein HID58_041208 [Brassica napus]|uniref:Uncharacterized protein n=1 Tax=Brassica napus TaxID=3708 RepID=A0ABQ8BBR8_BRANA|nr:hypothetical protein HID58_041208 [Brassica napus]